jgi:two-component system sensor histidine kinase DesK
VVDQIKLPGPLEAAWLDNQRQWARGWRRLVFPGAFLVYLVQTAVAVNRYSAGAAAIAGYAIILAFCVAYLMGVRATWACGPTARFWLIFASLIVLCAAEAPFAHGDAFVMVVYLVVLSVGGLGLRAVPVVAVLTAAAVFIPAAVPSWHSGIDIVSAISLPMLALAMFAFFAVVRGNHALNEARSEVARLAAENERTRIARDLHDLLGHSLTAITVKAGLARRLAQTNPEQAAIEIAEVEALSRQSLADVRAAVANYRDVSLGAELATGAELLRAAGVEANLPGVTDAVVPQHRELFAWVVREGLTNVVRHAHATACTVTITATSVEIVDDGIGGATLVGSGLRGLRERVAAAGGTIHAGPIDGDGAGGAQAGGWRLAVEVPERTGPAPASVEPPPVPAFP